MKNKILLKLTRFSLGKRLTLYFIIFAFIIGYFIFIMSTIAYSKNMKDFFEKSIIAPQFNDLRQITRKDVLLEIIDNKNQKLVEESLDFYEIASKINNVNSVKLFYFNKKKNNWKEIYLNDEKVFKLRNTKINDTFHLDSFFYHPKSGFNKSEIKSYKQIRNKYKSRIRKSYLKKSFSEIYFGKTSAKKIQINLTRPIDDHIYILSFDIKRKGIVLFIKEHMGMFIIFDIVLLIVSAFLGKFFAMRIAKPISKISRGSSIIASGNYDYRFKIKRKDEIGILAGSLNTMANKIETNINKIQTQYKTMESMNMIDKAVLSSISRNDLMDRVIGIVSSLFPKTNINILLRNEDKNGFDILYFEKEKNIGFLKEEPCICDKDIDDRFLNKMNEQYQLIYNSKTKKIFKSIEEMSGKKIGSFLNMPLFMSDQHYGSMFITKDDKIEFKTDEVNYIRMLSDQICIALQSVKIFEEKEILLLGILLALTKSIDAKSKWTAGHSERVAKYVEEIGLRMNFNEENLRKLTISAILHDIGKIAVPEIILDKPSKLTVNEYNIIKEHPAVGAKIISDIPSYNEILPGILYHHERWDGTGYPNKLTGLNIPLNARIITVADVFDAITDDRPYRKGMKRDEALRFMEDQKGKLFDKELVDVFLEYTKGMKNLRKPA